MYYTPGTPGTPGHLPGSPMFRDSTMKSFGQGVVGNVSLSTWGSDFSPTMFDRGNTYSPVSFVNFLFVLRIKRVSDSRP